MKKNPTSIRSLIVDIVNANPAGITIYEIYKAIQKKGRITSDGVLRSTVSTLCNTQEIKRLRESMHCHKCGVKRVTYIPVNNGGENV